MQGRPVRVQRLKLGVGASRERGEPCWEQNSSARMVLWGFEQSSNRLVLLRHTQWVHTAGTGWFFD